PRSAPNTYTTLPFGPNTVIPNSDERTLSRVAARGAPNADATNVAATATTTPPTTPRTHTIQRRLIIPLLLQKAHPRQRHPTHEIQAQKAHRMHSTKPVHAARREGAAEEMGGRAGVPACADRRSSAAYVGL